MTITKHGRCEDCGKACTEKRDFLGTVDMFDPEAKPRLEGDLALEIKLWRDDPLYCEEHRS